jgi:hypothetical protein
MKYLLCFRFCCWSHSSCHAETLQWWPNGIEAERTDSKRTPKERTNKELHETQGKCEEKTKAGP